MYCARMSFTVNTRIFMTDLILEKLNCHASLYSKKHYNSFISSDDKYRKHMSTLIKYALTTSNFNTSHRNFILPVMLEKYGISIIFYYVIKRKSV